MDTHSKEPTNNLTDREFWISYWENKTDLIFNIPDSYPFVSQLNFLIRNNNTQSLLEIGGFPGYYSIWAKKNTGIDVTLLDFVIHQRLLHQLAVANDLADNINIVEADLFEYKSDKKFDLVMSNGLIEHFIDTKSIIKKHIDLLSSKGTLFITLPNLRGVNGWFQKKFDRVNYDRHYIGCMDLKYLRRQCEKLNLKEIKVNYYGGFMLWLENEKNQPVWVRLFQKSIWLPLKIITTLLPFESKALSPYITLTARI